MYTFKRPARLVSFFRDMMAAHSLIKKKRNCGGFVLSPSPRCESSSNSRNSVVGGWGGVHGFHGLAFMK